MTELIESLKLEISQLEQKVKDSETEFDQYKVKLVCHFGQASIGCTFSKDCLDLL